ncbi:MAG: (4Fe-4S)-binding protein [Tepidiformaceae bacterium]
MTEEERHRPEVLREYEGSGITVHWQPRLCIHVANCIRNLPGVFDPQARPWVNVTAATADEIAQAVETCPTGALRYVRTDGARQEQPAKPTAITPMRDGALVVRGELEVIDSDGNVTREAARMALCRCGHSKNKPYCDLSHLAVGFKS